MKHYRVIRYDNGDYFDVAARTEYMKNALIKAECKGKCWLLEDTYTIEIHEREARNE